MKKTVLLSILIIYCGLLLSCKDKEINNPNPPVETEKVQFWLTSPSGNILFAQQDSIVPDDSSNSFQTITINPAVTFQEMDGFGFALTGGSALHIHNMSASSRTQLLTELFDDSGNNIGISYLRISIGASDLDAEVFSYDDLPAGQTDTAMQNFSIDRDKQNLIPVLKEIMQINPNIKILGSPWSPPVWMKTNKNSVGGSLMPIYYSAYAKYFVRYIEEMKNEGITIDAITVQNEPLHPGNNPSMLMLAADQANFIKNHLGPAFQNAGIITKIICYDHNADRIDYPLAVLGDASAKQYIDGSAFHLYGGDINALSTVHNAHPDKNLYFTEQWVGANDGFAGTIKWHISNLIIGAARNWCRVVLEWNLTSDQNYEPHTPGGCTECKGGVTIQGESVIRNAGYYIIAHASKFVRPGSVRIDSNIPADLPNAAYKTPENKTAVIVLNNKSTQQTFNIKIGDKFITTSLPGGAVGTYVW